MAANFRYLGTPVGWSFQHHQEYADGQLSSMAESFCLIFEHGGKLLNNDYSTKASCEQRRAGLTNNVVAEKQ